MTKISDLDPVVAPTGTEEIPCRLGGANGSITPIQISSIYGVVPFNPTGADGANYFAGLNVGNQTMSPDGGASILASRNFGFGKNVLSLLTTGYNNIGIGGDTLGLTTVGSFNTGIGEQALGNNVSGVGNTGIGATALYATTTGNHNTAIGLQCMFHNTTGRFNTAAGRDCLFSNTTGEWNVAIGTDSNPGNSTGSGNTTVGGECFYGRDFADASANQNLTGSNNTIIGYHAGSTGGAQNRQNCTAIGYDARVTADNQVAIGNSSVTETVLQGNVKVPRLTVNGATPTLYEFSLAGINFNSGNSDNVIAITLPVGLTRYYVSGIRIQNASASLTTSTFQMTTGAGGAGTAIQGVTANTVATAADANPNNAMFAAPTNANTMTLTVASFPNLYFRVVTPQGSTATGTVVIEIRAVP